MSKPSYTDTATQELPVPSEHDFHIHSSALRRAFPDFSQYGSSEEDSIELGRGLKGSIKSTQGKTPRSADITENLSFSFGAGSRYEITATPPMKPRDKVSRQSSIFKNNTRASSMKENVDPLGRSTDMIGKSQDGRKVLGESMHARVESDDTGSLSDRRPAPVISNGRNTRFDRRNRHPSANEVTGTIDVNENAKAMTKLEQAIHNGTVTGTHQSFLLPDLPNITELVSGVRQDGTPLFNRSAKAASRFGTPSQLRKSSTLKQTHVPISSVPIPVDEKALYVSLQLLQDKVAGLEAEKANVEEKLEEYELENLQLKSKIEEQEHRRYSDSAMGTDIEEGKRRDWEGQKTRTVSLDHHKDHGSLLIELESSIRSLQDRLDRANRKLATSEVTIATMTNDRDAAHQQLAVAYLNSEELRTESEAMQKEVADVQNEFAKTTRRHEARISQLTNQEAELRGKIERREKAVREMSSLAKELWETRNALAASRTTLNSAKAEMQERTETPQVAVTDDNSMRIGAFASTTAGSRVASAGASSTNNATHFNNRQRSQSRGRQQSGTSRQTQETTDATTDLNIEFPLAQNGDLSIDSTYLSFMDGDEVSKLRRIVEEDKALLAQTDDHEISEKTQHTFHEDVTNKTNHTVPLPRKSSMKAVSYNLDNATKQSIREDMLTRGHTREHATYDDEPMHGEDASRRSISPEKQDTQQSIASQRSQRRTRTSAVGLTDMTSGFIVPDITLRGVAAITPSGSSGNTHGSKQTSIITRPIPVSDRMPAAAAGDDHTIRPGQSPGLALATVLQGLEDELQTLREQLVQQETIYNQHDPSLSKRQRKIVYARIHKLLAMIETRADQIYSLYDVLEGQKDKGQLMQEQEVEVTLQHIGIDLAAARRVSGQTVKMTQTVQDDSDADIEDDDEELPWEGIEATQTQTLPSLRLMRVR